MKDSGSRKVTKIWLTASGVVTGYEQDVKDSGSRKVTKI